MSQGEGGFGVGGEVEVLCDCPKCKEEFSAYVTPTGVAMGGIDFRNEKVTCPNCGCEFDENGYYDEEDEEED